QNFGTEPLAIEEVRVEGRRASLAPAIDAAHVDDRSVVYRVRVLGLPPLGPFCDTITFQTNLPEFPEVQARVSGIVTGNAEFHPWQLHLGYVPAGTTRDRVVRAHFKDGVSVRRISTDVEGLDFRRIPRGRDEDFFFSFLSDEADGPINGHVLLELTDGTRVRLAVIGECVPPIAVGAVRGASGASEPHTVSAPPRP
ncbi:MAG: hypothetical protein JXR94_02010, partial [Candidatus Hydrogenedentes bacterium]|nr:hypothetical protein [Candidatus Hydrogenedentota bacterium]